MANTYKSGSHNKYLLQYHLIFVCKYRKKLLSANNIASDIKRLSLEICSRHNITIHYMEVDKDHIQLKTLQSWEQGWRNTPECLLYMVQRILELEKN